MKISFIMVNFYLLLIQTSSKIAQMQNVIISTAFYFISNKYIKYTNFFSFLII